MYGYGRPVRLFMVHNPRGHPGRRYRYGGYGVSGWAILFPGWAVLDWSGEA